MAELTYRAAVTRAIRQEMLHDDRVFLIGEDVAKAGGVFKTTGGLLDEFGPRRVMDTPISEVAIIGAAMGAAAAGLRPIAEIMFADFVGVCQDMVTNQIAKARYMSDGQINLPLVIRFGSGGGLRFGAQHSQSVENWMMAIPGLKVVAPSTPEDLIGLFAAAVRDPDPVMFIEHKGLLATKGEVPDGEIVDELGRAKIVRPGRDATIVAIGMMVSRALKAAEVLAGQGLDVEVIDVRSLVPRDVTSILDSVRRTGVLFTVEENPRLCGWGAEIVSIAVEEAFDSIDGPPIRITTPHIPLPHAGVLEDAAIPSVDRIADIVAQQLI
jgi:pyruvate/2-oxoglutarate/acetoin dehydrogenase E1 component